MVCKCRFDCMRENKGEQLFAECGKFDYTRSVKHTVAAYRKYHCCLKSSKWYNFCTWSVIFSTCMIVNIQLNCHSVISSSIFHSLFATRKSACSLRSQFYLCCYMLTCVVMLSAILLFILPLDSIIESKRKCERNNFIFSLFYDAFSVTRLHSVYHRATSER
jgi:hypothetical protein